MAGQRLVADIARLQAQHAGDDRQAILDPMVHLLQKRLVPLQRRLKHAYVALSLDSHAQNIRGALQKSKIMFFEVAGVAAVYFQDSKRPAVSLQDHVHRALHAVPAENLWRAKTLLVFQVVRDHGLSR